MAKKFAKVEKSIWNDPKWWALHPNAKLVFFTLLTYPTTRATGLADWYPSHLESLTLLDSDELSEAGKELEEAELISWDEARNAAQILNYNGVVWAED